jgi:hypothetical protein
VFWTLCFSSEYAFLANRRKQKNIFTRRAAHFAGQKLNPKFGYFWAKERDREKEREIERQRENELLLHLRRHLPARDHSKIWEVQLYCRARPKPYLLARMHRISGLSEGTSCTPSSTFLSKLMQIVLSLNVLSYWKKK